MLNENLSSLYEEMRNYTRGTDISTPMLVLGNIFLRYAIDNRIGLVLDRNFDLYIQMARNLENPYHLYEKSELEEFLSAIDDALLKDGYRGVSDIISTLSNMWNEDDNRRFTEILGTRSFRATYQEFLNGDFRKKEHIESLMETLSYQSRKDWRDKRSYSVGTLLKDALDITNEDLVKTDLEGSEFLVSAIASGSDCRTITAEESLEERLISPLSRRIGKIEENEKNTLLITDEIPDDIEEALGKSERIAYLAPSALLLSSGRDNLERREKLIGSGAIEAVIVLPSLTAASSENITLMILDGENKERIAFADLNSKAKDREYFRENQLTDKAVDVIEGLLKEERTEEGMTTMVDYDVVRERKMLVPMNYLELRNEAEDDTEELEKRIDSLYGKLAALIGL